MVLAAEDLQAILQNKLISPPTELFSVIGQDVCQRAATSYVEDFGAGQYFFVSSILKHFD